MGDTQQHLVGSEVWACRCGFNDFARGGAAIYCECVGHGDGWEVREIRRRKDYSDEARLEFWQITDETPRDVML